MWALLKQILLFPFRVLKAVLTLPGKLLNLLILLSLVGLVVLAWYFFYYLKVHPHF